jgi:hypothetical protein
MQDLPDVVCGQDQTDHADEDFGMDQKPAENPERQKQQPKHRGEELPGERHAPDHEEDHSDGHDEGGHDIAFCLDLLMFLSVFPHWFLTNNGWRDCQIEGDFRLVRVSRVDKDKLSAVVTNQLLLRVNAETSNS